MVKENELRQQFIDSKEEWFAENIWIVYDVIRKRFSGWVTDYGDDMVSCGCIGLLRCKDKNEEVTYMWSMVEGYIKKWLYEGRGVFKKGTDFAIASIVNKVNKKLSEKSYDERFKEVMRMCRVGGIMVDEEYVRRVFYKVIEGDKSYEGLREGNEGYMGKEIEDNESDRYREDVETMDMCEWIKRKVGKRYSKKVTEIYYDWLVSNVRGDKLTNQELADKYGVSRQYINKRLLDVGEWIRGEI